MPEHAERVHLFADDELSEDERAAFRDHLTECQSCQRELETILLLRGMVRDLAPVRRRIWIGATALAAAALIAIVVVTRKPDPPAVFAGQHRPLIERLTYRPAAGYRDAPVVMRAGHAPDAVSIAALEAVRQAGDRHGELALWLWAGDLDEASTPAGLLSRDPASANDRAVLALRRGRLDEAQSLLDELLARDPASAAGHWNRALLFERLDDRPGARRDYEAVINLHEPGWEGEARARAARLR